MGQMKRLMEDQWTLRAIAVGVLVHVGALKECEWHEGYYFDGSGDLEAAYRAANAKITGGEIGLPGDMSRRNLTDEIKEAYEEFSAVNGCTYCDHLMRKDD